MRIALDLDNTLVDELGSTLRPGIIDFLEMISVNNDLVLWTNSRKSRALEIINHHKIRKYFSRVIAREDYDPEDTGVLKDTKIMKVDLLIDDSPEEININKDRGLRISSYRKNKPVPSNELEAIYKEIIKRMKRKTFFFK